MSGDSRFFAQFGGSGGGGGGISELEVGVTPIVGGDVGRLLFEGNGNVLQESNGYFGILLIAVLESERLCLNAH